MAMPVHFHWAFGWVSLKMSSSPEVRGPSFMKPFFIRYDIRITHMITKTAQAQDQSPINLQANCQMYQNLLS